MRIRSLLLASIAVAGLALAAPAYASPPDPITLGDQSDYLDNFILDDLAGATKAFYVTYGGLRDHMLVRLDDPGDLDVAYAVCLDPAEGFGGGHLLGAPWDDSGGHGSS